MKLSEIVDASPGLQKLILQDLPLRAALDIMRLTERVNPFLRFFGEEEIKAGGAAERMAELRELAIDDFDDFQRIPLTVSDGIKLSPSDVKHLTHFIDFQEVEK